MEEDGKIVSSKTDMNRPWGSYMEPFQIRGNLYYVGCYAASSHLIDTGDGLILIDTGYPQNLYQLIHNIYKLGFDIKDIRYIIHSHGHYDHLGGTKALTELTGAKTFIGKGDEDYANGKVDLTWAKELGFEYYEAFEPDVIMEDKDVISLGNTSIEIVSTPGHTPGTVSMFFEIQDEDQRSYKVAMHGGVGINSMMDDFLEKYSLSSECRQKFLEGIDRVKDRPVDIFIGNHVWNNDTMGKYERMIAGEENAFVDGREWKQFLERCAEDIRALEKNDDNIKKEKETQK